MAISDDLNSIRTHLEDDYTALEQLGVSVEDRNIENIKDMANQIYAKFPKTDYAEGSNITLSNTLKGKLDFEDGIVGYGDTKQAIIPSEYQQVEYIESSGTEFINTGIMGNNQLKIEATLKTKTVGVSQAVFGFFSSEGNKSLFLYCSSGKQFQVGYGAWENIDILWQDNELYNISLSNGKIIINGTEKTIETASSFTTDYSMTIFKISGSSGSGMPIQLYKFKIYDNNTLVRDFIPCYRISDNVIGMYDTVSKTFFTNAGTGTFTKGANAPTPSTPINIQVVRGKNLLEITSNFYISGGTYVSGANTNQFKITATAQDVFFNQVTSTNGTYNANNGNKISCRYGETIYFASGNEYWGRHFITEFNSSNTSLGFTAVSGATGSYTPTHTDCSFITMRFGNGNGVSGTTYTLAPIVCKTSDTSYLPYNTLEVVERGKNLLNLQPLEELTTNGITFTPVYKNGLLQYVNVNGTATGVAAYNLQGGNVDQISTYPNTLKKGTYTFSDFTNYSSVTKVIYLRYSYNNTTYTAVTSQVGYNTFTLTEDAKYATYIRIQTGEVINNVKFYPMLVKGSTPSDAYEPYITPTSYQLSLGEYEFAKIGNYVDYIWTDRSTKKWYFHEAILEVTLTSSMCVSVTGSASYGALCYLNFYGKADNGDVCAMSDKFVGVSYDDRTLNPTTYRVFTADGSGAVTIRFPNNSTIDTLQEVKDFVDSNEIKVKYALQTANDIEITDTTLINQLEDFYNSHSFTGTTIIEIDGQLPLIIKVRALKGE